jgi:hypothetical protein
MYRNCAYTRFYFDCENTADESLIFSALLHFLLLLLLLFFVQHGDVAGIGRR